VDEYGRVRQAIDDSMMWHMRFVWWMTKATETHSEYGILIAFPLQHWFHEHTSVIHYVYIALLVNFSRMDSQSESN